MQEKPKIDAHSENKFSRERFNYTGRQHGAPQRDNVCIICGYKHKSVIKSLCEECADKFPTKVEDKTKE